MGQSSFVIHEGLRIFELQSREVGEVREDMNKLLTIGRIGAQCCPICRIGLWNQTFPIFLQYFLIARRFDIPLLHFGELLLKMRIERRCDSERSSMAFAISAFTRLLRGKRTSKVNM